MVMTYPMSLIASGDPLGALEWVFLSYIGYGILWIYFLMIMFFTVQTKTESYAISGVMVLFGASLLGMMFPVEVQPYFNLLLGILATPLLYKVVKE